MRQNFVTMICRTNSDWFKFASKSSTKSCNSEKIVTLKTHKAEGCSDLGQTYASANCGRNEERNGSAEMAGFLQSLQSSLTQLVQASKSKAEAFNNLGEDILPQPDLNEDDEDVVAIETTNSLDLTVPTNHLLDSISGQSPKSISETSPPDAGAKDDLLESLTQALLPNSHSCRQYSDRRIVTGLSQRERREASAAGKL